MKKTEIQGISPRKSGEHFTYNDNRKWPEDERWELIRGTAYAMSPAAYRPRRRLFPGGGRGARCVDTVLQPDIFVVCEKPKRIDEVVRGAPDFVLEKRKYGLPKVASLREPVPVAIFPGLVLQAREEDL